MIESNKALATSVPIKKTIESLKKDLQKRIPIGRNRNISLNQTKHIYHMQPPHPAKKQADVTRPR